jgi:hypothetical protein
LSSDKKNLRCHEYQTDVQTIYSTLYKIAPRDIVINAYEKNIF